MLDMAPARKPGRPPLSREGSTVRSIRLQNSLYDDLIRYAHRNDIENIADLIREAIELRLRLGRPPISR
jgi:hypothetical protein